MCFFCSLIISYRDNLATLVFEAAHGFIPHVFNVAHNKFTMSCRFYSSQFTVVRRSPVATGGGYGGLVGLAPQTKLQAPQTEIWNTLNK